MQIKKSLIFIKNIYDSIKNDGPEYSHADHLESVFNWLFLAQKMSEGGGVSIGYHLYHGWLKPYPETTGYIIETVFNYAALKSDENIGKAAIGMADWLCKIQNEDGSIPDPSFQKKMVFDTGQVLFGFIRSFRETDNPKYLACAKAAGRWLISVQEEDGSWRKHAAHNIPHTYYSRVAWSLLELYKTTGEEAYLTNCLKNIEWCLQQQNKAGWFRNAGFTIRGNDYPFTHTIAYTLRGIFETAIFLNNHKYLNAVFLAVRNLLPELKNNGFLPGYFNQEWKGDQRFTCLTGNAQLAIIMFKLFQHTKEKKYYQAALKLNSYLKSKQHIATNNININGAIAGSYPIWGKYIHFNYPNWAAKFFADALIIEEQISHDISSQ